MIMYDPGPAIFEADPADEFRLSFTVPDVLSATGRETLMTMRCFEEQKFLGAILWLGEHQHLWPAWRRVAEAEGGNVLSGMIIELARKEAKARFGAADYLFEQWAGAELGSTGRRGIELSARLPTRTLIVSTHRFLDRRCRDGFMRATVEDPCKVKPVALAEIALLRGRAALSRELDRIAGTINFASTVH